ncbi:MAG: 2'-5' RNA ligase family protein [Anaerolineales bacterium]|jgi:2'-5' RNA ligase
MDRWEEWQIPYQFGSIVIWPPDDVRRTVNAQRTAYDPVSQSYCEAHITITQPLLRRLNDPEWENVFEIVRQQPSFEIRYGPLNSFLPYPCIWYAIEPQDILRRLNHVLHETGYFKLDPDDTREYIPHMTITEGLADPRVDERLFESLQAESEDGAFLCSEFVHIVPDERFRFHVHRAIPLG